MEITTIGQVIAERRYRLSTELGSSKEIIVRLGAPVQSGDAGAYYCPFEIVGFGETKISAGYGADAFQAIQLTLKIIGLNLHHHRQSYGDCFFLDQEADDLGFPDEAWTEGLGTRIARAFGPLYGLRLSVARNAGSMKNFQFGTLRRHPKGKGTIGQHALHVQCPWRIVTAQCRWQMRKADLMMTGSSDWWEPAEQGEHFDWDTWNEGRATPSLQQKLLEVLFQQYDPETQSHVNISDKLVVEQVDADDYGGLDIHLSGAFRLQVFPSGKKGEHWRLFQPGSAETHFAMEDGRLTASDATNQEAEEPENPK